METSSVSTIAVDNTATLQRGFFLLCSATMTLYMSRRFKHRQINSIKISKQAYFIGGSGAHRCDQRLRMPNFSLYHIKKSPNPYTEILRYYKVKLQGFLFYPITQKLFR